MEGGSVQVESRPLQWELGRLVLGAPDVEVVALSPGAEVEVGDWVSLHWEWVCDRLTGRQLADLRGYSNRHLRMVNEELAVPLEAAG